MVRVCLINNCKSKSVVSKKKDSENCRQFFQVPKNEVSDKFSLVFFNYKLFSVKKLMHMLSSFIICEFGFLMNIIL